MAEKRIELLKEIRDAVTQLASVIRSAPSLQRERVLPGPSEELHEEPKWSGEDIEKYILTKLYRLFPAAVLIHRGQESAMGSEEYLIKWNDNAYITIDSSNRILFFAEGDERGYIDATGWHTGSWPS